MAPNSLQGRRRSRSTRPARRPTIGSEKQRQVDAQRWVAE